MILNMPFFSVPAAAMSLASITSFGCFLPTFSTAAPAAAMYTTANIDNEQGILDNIVQLTFDDEFLKAGESYFSPDGSKIIFQGIKRPIDGQHPEAHYQMFIADVIRDDSGSIRSIDDIIQLSPPGSSNTCGWFHPTKPDIVIFGTTLTEPTIDTKSGYQRERGEYMWNFPREMTIVECDISTIVNHSDVAEVELKPLIQDPDAYLAECVMSPDGRYLVYCRRVVAEGQRGGDLVIRDLETGNDIVIAGNSGYDGGPFFSPGGDRLCYRSDRRGDNLLQVFVAELEFDDSGNIVGLEREFQLTDNPYVNWAPNWHPQDRHIVYTTNEISPADHKNYEIFISDADAGGMSGEPRPVKYGTRKRRITFAEGFDGLPAFNADGSEMIWTSQRGEGGTSQLFAADFVFDLDTADRSKDVEDRAAQPSGRADRLIQIRDDERNMIYLYNPQTHGLQIYDPQTHEARDVTDPAEMQRALELFRQNNDDD